MGHSGIPDQHAELQPTGPLAETPDLSSPTFQQSPFEVDDPASEHFFNEVMNHTTDDDDPAGAHSHFFDPLPRPVRHVTAPEPHELTKPKPKTAVKIPLKRPKAKKSPTTKKTTSPSHSEAATPWTQE